MTVDETTLRSLYTLSRIAPPEGDVLLRFQKDLNSLLRYVEILESVDTTEVEPFLHPGQELQRRRADRAKEILGRGALAGASRLVEGQVSVPKVVD